MIWDFDVLIEAVAMSTDSLLSIVFEYGLYEGMENPTHELT